MQNDFLVSLLCEIAEISRSSYYSWKKNYKPNKFEEFDKALQEVFLMSGKTYGYRRMYQAMKALGFNESEKTIRKRMKQLKLICEIRQKKYTHSKSEKIDAKCKNYLNQDFNPCKPNRYFSVDITCIPTKNGMVYLNVILDLFGKMPVAYMKSYTCNSKLAEDTLDILIKERKSVKNALIHSDRGVTYLSDNYRLKLNNLKLIRSNSKKGYPYDNACSECFFSILKTEKLHRLGYIPQNKEEVDEIIEEYIDFYINKRISTSLEGLTPKQYYDNYIDKRKRLAKTA